MPSPTLQPPSAATASPRPASGPSPSAAGRTPPRLLRLPPRAPSPSGGATALRSTGQGPPVRTAWPSVQETRLLAVSALRPVGISQLRSVVAAALLRAHRLPAVTL